MVVDFPAPLAPIIATVSPDRTSSAISLSTGAAPYPAVSFSVAKTASRGPLQGFERDRAVTAPPR